jgi:hypothetical protein
VIGVERRHGNALSSTSDGAAAEAWDCCTAERL